MGCLDQILSKGKGPLSHMNVREETPKHVSWGDPLLFSSANNYSHTECSPNYQSVRVNVIWFCPNQ